MSERGFIAVDRGIFDHPLFEEKHEFSRREAWLWLLTEAEWKPRVKMAGSTKIGLERGQLAHSVRFMADAWGWHKSKVERFLGRLKTETMIETLTETGITVVTICNYDRYQSAISGRRDTKKTNVETAARQQRDKLKETNKLTTSSDEEEEEVGARDPVSVVVDAYSAVAARSKLPAIIAVNEKRKSAIKARVGEHGLDGVLKAISKLGASDFCCGISQTGWKADFDFLLQPSSMIKILEGKYDNRAVVAPEKPPDLADLFNRRAEEERLREEYDDGRTIETSYEHGDFDRPGQTVPRLAAAKGFSG